MQKAKLNGSAAMLTKAIQDVFEESRAITEKNQQRFHDELRGDLGTFKTEMREQSKIEHLATRNNTQKQLAVVHEVLAQQGKGITTLQADMSGLKTDVVAIKQQMATKKTKSARKRV